MLPAQPKPSEPSRRPPRRHSVGETRELLLSAAKRVVERDGVAAATTRAIAAEAGLSLSSFHYAFRSHDELMVELIRRAASGETDGLAAVFDDPDLASRLSEASVYDVAHFALTQFVQSVKDDPHRERAMLELTHYALRNTGSEHLAQLQYEQYYKMGRSGLEIITEVTGTRWLLPLDALSRFIVVLTDGLTLAWLVDRDEEHMELLIESAARAVAAQVAPDQG